MIVRGYSDVCDSTIVEQPSNPEKEFLGFCLYNASHAEARRSSKEYLNEGSSKDGRRIIEG